MKQQQIGVDVVAVLRQHADAHLSAAASDAYSHQEAPKLEAACAAVSALVKALEAARYYVDQVGSDPFHVDQASARADLEAIDAALAQAVRS